MCKRKSRDQLALPRLFGWINWPCYSPDPSYGALQVLQLNLKLKDTIISSTQEELEAEGANSSRKPVTEEETLEGKEEIANMQVAAICYFPAGPFYLLLSVCSVKHGVTAALIATTLVVSPISCSFSVSGAARCWYGLSDWGQWSYCRHDQICRTWLQHPPEVSEVRHCVSYRGRSLHHTNGVSLLAEIWSWVLAVYSDSVTRPHLTLVSDLLGECKVLVFSLIPLFLQF